MADSQLFGLFEPETGRKVSRFGAALGGRLPQFDKLQEARQQRLSDERKKAFVLDNRAALRLLKANNPEGAKQLLQNRIGEVSRLGGDPSQSQQILTMLDAGDIKGVTEGLGMIDNRAVDAGLLKALPELDALDQKKLALAERKFAFEQKKFTAAQDPAKKDVIVKAQEVLPNGTVIQSIQAPRGEPGVRVFSATGERLHGQDVIDSIEAGRKMGIRVAGDTAAAQAEADQVKQSIKISGEMFKQIGPIRQSLLTIGKARQALAEGAETGVIDKFLPDIREASIKLTNLMNQLGLDVVSGTTFGALSAGELALALDTALPTGLQPEALDRWLQDKDTSQRKLLEELQGDVMTLSGGGTIAGIIQSRRTAGTSAPQRATQALPQGVTEDDITETMRANGMTRAQVLSRLGGRQ